MLAATKESGCRHRNPIVIARPLPKLLRPLIAELFSPCTRARHSQRSWLPSVPAGRLLDDSLSMPGGRPAKASRTAAASKARRKMPVPQVAEAQHDEPPPLGDVPEPAPVTIDELREAVLGEHGACCRSPISPLALMRRPHAAPAGAPRAAPKRAASRSPEPRQSRPPPRVPPSHPPSQIPPTRYRPCARACIKCQVHKSHSKPRSARGARETGRLGRTPLVHYKDCWNQSL